MLDAIGIMGTLSAVFGVDYYHYRDDPWIHGWGNVFPNTNTFMETKSLVMKLL